MMEERWNNDKHTHTQDAEAEIRTEVEIGQMSVCVCVRVCCLFLGVNTEKISEAVPENMSGGSRNLAWGWGGGQRKTRNLKGGLCLICRIIMIVLGEAETEAKNNWGRILIGPFHRKQNIKNVLKLSYWSTEFPPRQVRSLSGRGKSHEFTRSHKIIHSH